MHETEPKRAKAKQYNKVYRLDTVSTQLISDISLKVINLLQAEVDNTTIEISDCLIFIVA